MKKMNDKKIVDLRSDTVTKPSPQMWEALRALNNDALGDDVMREDPTINRLEKKAAELFDKEAALLVTSGTQGNLLSVLTHTQPGDEILVEEEGHIYAHEVGGAARLGGVMLRTYPSHKGYPDLEKLQGLVREKEDIHEPPTTLLCTENTHNFHGGVVLEPKKLANLKRFADENELKLHIDGARIFNASVALKTPVSKFAQYADSVMFCLSKGLSAPIGSMIVGSHEFIEKARKFRKMVGGGMRQAGIIAVFGLEALKSDWISRLEEDHKKAKLLAKGIRDLGLPLEVQTPQTNILMVQFPKTAPMGKIIRNLSEKGILAFDIDHKIRFVTHYGIKEKHVDYSVKIINSVLRDIL
ncbi:MAG: L-allo-threonine aldolase [Promethearchaeota archaeon]|nr:MAG: L-allo-threonine aldolase [Candidatus Lokiarchaeota archaeon]